MHTCASPRIQFSPLWSPIQFRCPLWWNFNTFNKRPFLTIHYRRIRYLRISRPLRPPARPQLEILASFGHLRTSTSKVSTFRNHLKFFYDFAIIFANLEPFQTFLIFLYFCIVFCGNLELSRIFLKAFFTTNLQKILRQNKNDFFCVCFLQSDTLDQT